MKKLTKELVRDLFNYDPETGILTNKIARGTRAKIGDAAGAVNKETGYLMVGINRDKYLVHRVCFIHYHGYLTTIVDHEDTNVINNRITNLRKCTKKQNAFNSKTPKTNTSGIKGVSWNKELEKWRVGLMVNSKAMFLGHFEDIKDAKNTIEAARIKYHGEFANNG